MKNKKKKSSNSTLISVLLILAVTFVIIALIFVVAINFGDTSQKNTLVSNNTSSEGEDVVSSSNKGFPVSFSEPISTVKPTDSCVFVLTDSSVTVLGSNGKEKNNILLNFAEPMLKTSKSYALLYDKQGTSAMLIDKKGALIGKKVSAPGQIVTGYVCDNGFYALATRHTDAVSAVTLYKRTGEIVYQWLCRNDYIVSIGVSDSANSIICAALNSKKGEMVTKIYYLDTAAEENNRDFTYEGTSPVDAFFTSGKNAAVICVDQRIVLRNKRTEFETSSVSFSSHLVKRASDSNGYSAIITKGSESGSENNTLTLYDDKNNILTTTPVSIKADAVACYGKKAYVINGAEITKISASGKLDSMTGSDLPSSVIGISVGARGIYCYTSQSVYCE